MFWVYSNWRQIKLSAPDLSSNFWWFRSANHLEFIEECGMCMEKHESKKTVAGVETHQHSGKEKVPGVAISKGLDDNF